MKDSDGNSRRIEALRLHNPNPKKNRIGERYGRYVVIAEAEPSPTKRTRWLCRCDCGTEKIVLGGSLSRGQTTSCGCAHREIMAAFNKEKTKHGHSAGLRDNGGRKVTPTYTTWKSMLERCRNQRAPNYHLYGGRGICICDQWKGPNGFAQFLSDVGERPSGKTIDRIDVNGHYEPGNVRWATAKEQAQNRRRKKTVK